VVQRRGAYRSQQDRSNAKPNIFYLAQSTDIRDAIAGYIMRLKTADPLVLRKFFGFINPAYVD